MTWDHWEPGEQKDLPGVAPEWIAKGPRQGFIDAFDNAWEVQRRTASRDAIAYFFSKLDDEQADRVRKAGKEYVPMYQQPIEPNLDRSTGGPAQFKPYYSRWSAYVDMADAIVNGKENGWQDYIAAQDMHVAKLNAEDPTLGLKTMGQMFDEVKASAHRAQYRGELPTTWGGLAGGFAGSMVGAVDPRTDIFNAATFPVGGAGKTALARIGSQALSQGAIETVNQFTGVQRNRELLGLDYGMTNALWQIGGAAAGGAVLQGAGEGLAAVARRVTTGRWFADAPSDPAPPQPAPTGPVQTTPQFEAAWARMMEPQQRSPMYAHPLGRVRADADMGHVVRSLSDWGGPRAWEIVPPTDTRVPGSFGNVFDAPDARAFTWGDKGAYATGVENVDSIARRIDPEAFRAYDRLAARREELRAEVGDLDEIKRVAEGGRVASEIKAQIAQLRAQLDNATGKAARKLEQRIDDLSQQYARQFHTAPDTPGSPGDMGTPGGYQSEVRTQLMQIDERMRDLAPTITRAYARAQGKWEVYTAQRAQIDEMMANGDAGISGKVTPALPSLPEQMPVPLTAKELAPELQKIEPKAGETLAQTVLRAHKDTVKEVETAVSTFQATVGKMSDMEHIVAERQRLDKAIVSQEERVKGLRGPEQRLEQMKLDAMREEREGLDTFKMTVDGKEYKLSLDEDQIALPTDDGGTRVVTARELLRELEHDNNMLKAVTTCSLPGTSSPV